MGKINFGEFISSNGYVPMQTTDENGNKVFTKYYINRQGEIGWKTNDGSGFKKIDFIPDKDGYNRMPFNVGGKTRMKFVHRLVAENFIPNQDPTHYTVINHKNRNIRDNRVENLEWVSVLQNAQHEKKTRNLRVPYKDYPILQIEVIDDDYCRVVNRFNSKRDIPKYIGNNPNKVCKSYIVACCKNFKYKHSYRNFKWIYEKDVKKLPYKIINNY